MSPDTLASLITIAHLAAVALVAYWLKKRYGVFPALVGAAFVLFLYSGFVTG